MAGSTAPADRQGAPVPDPDPRGPAGPPGRRRRPTWTRQAGVPAAKGALGEGEEQDE